MASQITRINLAPPASDEEFERAATKIARLYFRSDSFKRYGRSGQKQHGIDIRGQRDGDTHDNVVLQVKCRGFGKSEPAGELTKSVRAAVKREIAFQEFIYCTSAARDTALQDEAETMTLELADTFPGEKRLVQVWDWTELEEMAHDDSRVMAVLQINTAVVAPLVDLEDHERPVKLAEIELITDNGANGIDEHGPNQGVIDHITTYVNTRPAQALGDLNNCMDGSKPLTTIERSQMHALKGHAYRAMGNHDSACASYELAYDLTPLREPSIANYAWALARQERIAEFAALVNQGLTRFPESENIALRAVEVLGDSAKIPDALRDRYYVKLAHHNNALEAMSPEQSLVSARALSAIKPTDFNSKLALADALMNTVIRDPGANAFASMTPESRNQLEEATAIYSSLWSDTVEKTDDNVEVSSSLACNFMLALRTQGRPTDAVSVGLQALPRTNDQAAVSERLFMVKMDIGDDKLEDVVEQIGDGNLSSDLRLRLSAGMGRWQDVVDLLDSEKFVGEDPNGGFLRGLRTVAEINLLPTAERKAALDALPNDDTEDPRELTLRAQLARNHGQYDSAQLYLERAASFAGEAPSEVIRMSIVGEAMAQDHKELIYKYLAGFVDYERDSDILRALVRMAAYEYPPRQRAAEVFSKLSSKLTDQTQYLHWRSIYHQQRGEWKEAQRVLQTLSTRRNSLGDWFSLYRCALALSDDARAEALIKRSDLEEMEASPTELIQTAWILKRHHEGARALAFALKAIRDPRG